MPGGLNRERQEQLITGELDAIRQANNLPPELIRLAGALERLSIPLKSEMVRIQRLCKAPCCRFSKDVSQPADEIVMVFVILEYPAPFDSAANDMVRSTGDVDTGLSRHFGFVAQLGMPGKL